jgi:LysM repeat protein
MSVVTGANIGFDFGARKADVRGYRRRELRGGAQVGVLTGEDSGVVDPRFASMNSWRLTVRGRVALWLFVGLVALIGLGISNVMTAPQITSAPQQTLAMVPASQASGTVVVRPGDSLWTIAQRELGYLDPREAVVELRRLNNISGGQLMVGQELVLPVR